MLRLLILSRLTEVDSATGDNTGRALGQYVRDARSDVFKTYSERKLDHDVGVRLSR